MNAQLLKSTLDNAYANCLAYSSKKGLFPGSYLAVGRTDGFVTVWDVETRNVLRWFGGHVKTVTSVSWSPYNRYLATSSLDWNVHVLDLAQGRIVRSLHFDAPVVQVLFAPDTSCRMVVLLDSREGVLVTASAAEPTRVPLTVGEGATAACFTPSGKHLFLGTTKGNVVILDAISGSVQGEPVPIGGSSVRQLAFDATGRHLVANLNDRTLRTFSVAETRDKPTPYALTQRSKFQDLVGRTPWSGISFSADGEYVMGGAAQDAGHHIYLWDRDAGVLVKILEGPREPLISAQWHPIQPQLASIAASGDIYLWKTKWTEIWSAYAPGFEELEENVEYEEPEDEFDLVRAHRSPQEDENELSRKKQDEEEAVVNVFSTGPASDAWVLRSMQPYTPPTRRSVWAPRLGGDAEDVSMDDDDDQLTFFLAPLLEPADASERHV